MTSQRSRGRPIGPLGTHATVLGGAAAPLVGDTERLFHTTMAPYGIMPAPSPETKPFWDGAKEGKLVIQQCQSCGSYNHPPVAVCNRCGDRNAKLEFEQVSGRATLKAYYICYDTSVNGYEDKVPYAVLLVELEEQPDMFLMSNILNCEYDGFGNGLTIGMPLEVVFDKASDDICVPQFQPRSS